MDTDDVEAPVPKEPAAKLETLSIAELERRILELEAEIARIREAISDKQAVRGDAEALFRR
jgi:uncharacterized small protein (DUF1192 family)